MEPYTVVITSCGRFDLLEKTLASLLPRLEGPLAKIILIEDSGNEQILNIIETFNCREIDLIINPITLGQMKSIDLAYSNITTNWVFHCEDDWEFFSEGFIEKSFVILKELQHISMVSLRPREELNPLIRNSLIQKLKGISYFLAEPSLHPEYFGYSFNPGLRRLHDYRKVAPVADLPMGERDVSYCFKRLGYTMAYLEEPAVRHIGGGRHVDDPMLPRRPRGLRQRLAASAQKRLRRLHRRLDPSVDPAVGILKRLEQDNANTATTKGNPS